MSTAPPAPNLTPAQQRLNNDYQVLLQRCDALSIRFKQRLLTLWCLSMALTWVPLLLAIAALSGWLPTSLDPFLLQGVLPTAAFLNAAVTVAQFLLVFRLRWLKYRAATERLRENCMRFRARLHPFHRDDAEKHFGEVLVAIRADLEERRRRTAVVWDYLVGFQPLDARMREEFRHAADGGLYPRCDSDVTEAEGIIIRERLCNQRRWHLFRARSYSRRYLALQAGIVLLGLAGAVYGWFWGRQYGVLALGSTLTLFLVACRELLGYAPLCLRYVRLDETLKQIEAAYEETKKSHPEATPEQRLGWLRQTAGRVEQALGSEFQYWYFGRENFGGAASS